MTTKDEVRSTVEALKLALEALEESRNALAWFYDSYPQDVTEKGNELLPHVETVLTAIRAALASKSEALAEQPAQQQEWVACRDEMCACRGGPCASCPDGEREKELADMRDSRDFYKRRTDELQKAQSQMRDPERTMVCDILANGRLLVPAAGRYNTSPPASKAWMGLTDEQIMQMARKSGLDLDPPKKMWVEVQGRHEQLLILARAIEAKLKEKNGF